MNSRIVNADAYIFSAIMSLEKKGFTGSEVARLLIERYSMPKNLFKAKAFVYYQFQILVSKGLLTKTRKNGGYQYIYTRTNRFHQYAKGVKLLRQHSSALLTLEDGVNLIAHGNTQSVIINLLVKYESELEKISGEKEIYDELIMELPNHEPEFRIMSDVQVKKAIRLSAKIKALSRMIG